LREVKKTLDFEVHGVKSALPDSPKDLQGLSVYVVSMFPRRLAAEVLPSLSIKRQGVLPVARLPPPDPNRDATRHERGHDR
jgi:hypothetical protein